MGAALIRIKYRGSHGCSNQNSIQQIRTRSSTSSRHWHQPTGASAHCARTQLVRDFTFLTL